MCGGGCGGVEEGTGVGEEVVAGVLGVDTGFEGVSDERDFGLFEGERVACSDLTVKSQHTCANMQENSCTSSCHSTRSVPVTISVTGCSTWSRVFLREVHVREGLCQD